MSKPQVEAVDSIYSKYYSNFDEFKNSIYECLSKTHTEYKIELNSLLTLNFQTFTKELPWADQDFDPVLPTTNHESHPPFTETFI